MLKTGSDAERRRRGAQKENSIYEAQKRNSFPRRQNKSNSPGALMVSGALLVYWAIRLPAAVRCDISPARRFLNIHIASLLDVCAVFAVLVL